MLVVAAQVPGAFAAVAQDGLELNAFVAVHPDGTVAISIPSVEMGQGVITSLPQLVADELDVDFEQVQVVHAPVDDEFRASVAVAKEQFTGGSMSVRVWNEPLREAGAAARLMLMAAAAERWGVPLESVETDAGVVKHGEKSLTYGELAAEAAKQRPPKDPPLRRPNQVAGRSQPRQDLLPKVLGTAEFGIDVRLEGMLRASVRMCPVFGGQVDTVDDEAARAMPGVEHVLVFDDFVAVVAEGWWQAEQAAKKLVLTWKGGNSGFDEARIHATYDQALQKGGRPGQNVGNAKKALGDDPLEGTYHVPYLDHAPIEPLNCTVDLTGGRCRIWTGTQVQSRTVKLAAKLVGCRPDDVELTTTFLGGGFGRRGNIDFVEPALRIALRVDAPIQLIWSREQCTQHGFYRPGAKIRFRGRVENGRIAALHGHMAADNILYRYLPGFLVGLVGFAATFPLEGMRKKECPYLIENHRIELSRVDIPIPIGFWRSVGHSHNGFFLESFIDELAHAAGADPLQFRLDHIEDERYRRVLETLREKSDWGNPAPGRHQGVAIMECYGSVCAEVAEVSMVDGRPKVHRITAVVDCGEVVNPDIVQAQLMGGAVFGLSAAMGERLDLEGGAIRQSNFHDYPLLRMHEAPEVRGYTVKGPDSPVGGIGELAVPPLAPAVCNALFKATGKRIRSLPILEHFA